jgi:hypothetical protein
VQPAWTIDVRWIGPVGAVVPCGTTGPTATVQVQFKWSKLECCGCSGGGDGPGRVLAEWDRPGPEHSSPVDEAWLSRPTREPAYSGEIVSILLTRLGTVPPALSEGTGRDPSAPGSTWVLRSYWRVVRRPLVQLPSVSAGVRMLPVCDLYLKRVSRSSADRGSAVGQFATEVAEASGSRTHPRHRVPHNGFEARAQHRPRLASNAQF